MNGSPVLCWPRDDKLACVLLLRSVCEAAARQSKPRTLKMLLTAPAAGDQCSPWLRWLSLPVRYWSKTRPRRWNATTLLHLCVCRYCAFLVLYFAALVKEHKTIASRCKTLETRLKERSLIFLFHPLHRWEHHNILRANTAVWFLILLPEGIFLQLPGPLSVKSMGLKPDPLQASSGSV